MRLVYYAVAPRGTGEYQWVTSFARIDHMWCSLPSGKEGKLDEANFVFKRLTQVEYETYLTMGALYERESDDFCIWGPADSTMRRLEAEQTAFELHELDDVFDQSQ